MELIDAFTDIPQPQEITQPQSIINQSGDQSLGNLNTISVGFGTQVLRVDQQGLWLGSDKFTTAPFSVDMKGNIVATSATLGQYLTKAGTNQVMSGSIQNGNGNVLIDGANKRIIINDGVNDRVLIGYLAGGF